MHHLLKRSLSTLGAKFNQDAITRMRQIVSHVELGHWLKSQGESLPADKGMVNRWPILDVAISRLNTRRPLYLEFGVYRGQSIRYVSERVTSPQAKFIGFDSFEGLPETWRFDIRRGAFSLNGVVPEFEDERISIVKGWFDETLSPAIIPEHDQLLVNIDVDVYSSARSVLLRLEPLLRSGALLYMDEFNDSGNELRAFREFVERTGLNFRVEATSRCLSHWLFRCL
jgi:hypothetical protein